MNKVLLTGRIIKDPDLKIFEKNTSLCTFFIADEERYGNNKKTAYYKCKAWGKSGRAIAYHAEKNSKITLSGRLNQRICESKNGETIFDVSIIVENFKIINKPVRVSTEDLKIAS